MYGSPHMEKGVTFTQKKEIQFRESATFAIVTNKYKWNSSTNKTEASKGQTGKKVFETVRSSKVSLSEKIPIEQIKDTSIWHMRY